MKSSQHLIIWENSSMPQRNNLWNLDHFKRADYLFLLGGKNVLAERNKKVVILLLLFVNILWGICGKLKRFPGLGSEPGIFVFCMRKWRIVCRSKCLWPLETHLGFQPWETSLARYLTSLINRKCCYHISLTHVYSLTVLFMTDAVLLLVLH